MHLNMRFPRPGEIIPDTDQVHKDGKSDVAAVEKPWLTTNL